MNTRKASNILRTRLLLGACFLTVPGLAHAQAQPGCSNTTNPTTVCDVDNGITVTGQDTREFRVNASDNLTVTATGVIATAGNQAVSVNGISSGTGVFITNDGRIEGVPTNATNGRAISGSGDFTDRTTTITNRGTIIGGGDAIRFTEAAAGGDAGTITLDNSGSIAVTGRTNTAALQSGQGVEVTITGVDLNITNRAGGSISGSQGVLSTAANTTIRNFGTITGTAVGAPTSTTQGEAIRTNNETIPVAGRNLTVINEAGGRSREFMASLPPARTI